MFTVNEIIVKHFDDADFILRTQRQIEKDFAKFNSILPDSFTKEVWTKEQILHEIEFHLEEFSNLGETRLLQLMYTIDISESLFLKLTQSTNFISELAMEVLKREAYKVYLKEQFK